MLFRNFLVSDLFKELHIRANEQRKADARKRLDYYHDSQEAYLLEQLQRRFTFPEKLQPVFLNVVKKIVNRLAQVYQEDAKRTLDGTDRDKELFAAIATGCGLDMKLKTASRYTKLLKNLMLKVVWRGGMIDLDLVTPDILDVQTGNGPEDVVQVMVTNYGPSERMEDVTYSVWTPETWRKLDYRGGEIDGGPNPYGRIPFVPLFDYAPTSDFWLPGGDDLVSVQDAINERLVDLLHVLRFQAFGVGYIRGREGEGIDAVDPGSFVELPENGELGFADTEAKIEETLAAIDKLLKWAAVTNGLSAASLSTEPQEQSGVSKLADNEELQELRKDDVALFRRYEKQLFGVIRAVWNHHNPGKPLSKGASLQIDFFEPKPAMSPLDQVSRWERLLEMGIISPVDVALARNPDLQTREDALAYLLSIQAEREELRGGDY
jgi:hypothetical protein